MPERVALKVGCQNLSRQWRIFMFFAVPVCLSPIPIWLNTKSARAGYILLISSLFLVLEILPMPATVLFSLFLITDTMFMFTAVLILAISIEETRLHDRLALLTLRAIGVSSSRLIFGFLFISGILSMWMSNTAVTLMILPIAMAVSETLSTENHVENHVENPTDRKSHPPDDKDGGTDQETAGSETTVFLDMQSPAEETHVTNTPPQASPLSKALQLSTAYAANIGGMATLIGAYPNMLFRMTLEKLYGEETGLNFLSYFLVCAPMSLGSLLLTWVALSAMYVPNWIYFWRSRPDPDSKARAAQLANRIKGLGPITLAEITVVVLFSLTVLLWLTRDPKVFNGWGVTLLPRLASDTLPAMLAAVLLFVLPRNYGDLLRGHYTPILTWKQVVPKFPWELLLFIGGLTTITSVADSSGLIMALADLVPDLRNIPPMVLLAIISLMVATLTEVMSNSVITAILLPILANVSEAMAINPIYLMLAVTMASQFALMVPISSFPTVIVYNFGQVSLKDMAKSGLGPKVACLIFLIVSLEVLGGLVFDFRTFPEWADRRLRSRLQLLSNLTLSETTPFSHLKYTATNNTF